MNYQFAPFAQNLQPETWPNMRPNPLVGVAMQAADPWAQSTRSLLGRSNGAILGNLIPPLGGILGLGGMAATDDEFCKRVRNMCIAQCSDTSLPSGNYGFSFWNCVNKCMQRYGPTVRG